MAKQTVQLHSKKEVYLIVDILRKELERTCDVLGKYKIGEKGHKKVFDDYHAVNQAITPFVDIDDRPYK